MVYVFLATGFEDIEALAPVDILRRAGIEVQTVSISADRMVESAHGVGIQADIVLAEAQLDAAELMVLPGGLPGSTNLDACQPLTSALLRHYEAGRPVAAICAAPLVLGHLGILQGLRATCYPGVEGELKGATYTAQSVERDGRVVTGNGPAAAMAFGYALVELLLGDGAADGLRQGMMYNKLMGK